MSGAVMSSPALPAPPPPPGGQRRLLTLLFVDLSSSTAMAEWMEAEHYAAMLAGLRGLYEQIVPRHGGVIARIQGDGMLAVFGYPEVREDDGRRATETALELHAAVRELLPRARARPTSPASRCTAASTPAWC
jgi:class 3 adenylate cyclase